MALTLTKSPDLLSLTGNEIPFEIHSDDAYSSAGTVFEGHIAPTNWNTAFGTKLIQVTIVFAWTGHTLTLKNTTNTTTGDYDVSLAILSQNTLKSFVAALNRDYYFSRDFNCTIVSYYAGSPSMINHRLEIKAKQTGVDYNLACTIANGYSVITAGTDKVLRENFRIAWQVQLYDSVTSLFNDIGEIQLESPDADGDIFIDVSEFLQRDISGHFTWPQIYANNMTVVSIIDKYRIKYMEYYGADPDFYSVNYSSEALCLQGRISQLRMASIIQHGLSFYDYMVNNQKPLTFAPKEKLISMSQRDLFYFYCPLALSVLKFYIKAFYTDGTSSSDTLVKTLTAATGTFKDNIIEVFAGYSATGVGLLSPLKTVSKYQVWIADNTASKIMEVRTFIIDQNYNEFERYFIYRNKLGLYESLRTTGLSFSKLYTEKGFIKVPLSGDYDITERSTKQATVDKQVTITQNSGHIEDISIINYISEFLESADAYYCDNKFAYPITVMPGSYQLYVDKSGIYSFEFDYQFALEADSTEEFLIITKKGSFNSSFNKSYF